MSRKEADKKYYQSLEEKGMQKLSAIVYKADYKDLMMIIDRTKSDRKRILTEDTAPLKESKE